MDNLESVWPWGLAVVAAALLFAGVRAGDRVAEVRLSPDSARLGAWVLAGFAAYLIVSELGDAVTIPQPWGEIAAVAPAVVLAVFYLMHIAEDWRFEVTNALVRSGQVVLMGALLAGWGLAASIAFERLTE
ncbi:MAG: hypothetical protein O3A10_03480 [Chloroflexi bacterium]|nr:hypothetical protein [Chloroflexota bacterium]MDA1145797.1 hypothetical protein [Chloroflexota bacterium]